MNYFGFFLGNFYLQLHGTVMGLNIAPPFMAWLKELYIYIVMTFTGSTVWRGGCTVYQGYVYDMAGKKNKGSRATFVTQYGDTSKQVNEILQKHWH
ncbi:hypothetical protein XELAEV_18017146mg [Xenopus laevis]|uniref:Uncharacterized protein n=1 Tax=Xenopus laevis TaxID=8355 RepID=A0A974HS59_XENLA|nr:hypothetical protein XELAEV_18017146mg [Xenopus laevis]